MLIWLKAVGSQCQAASHSTGGKGLSRGGSGEETVWHEFADDQERLRRTADAIRANIRTASESPELASTGDDDLTEASEGRLVTRLHRNPERSRELVERKKASFKQEHGRLFCEACGFESSAVYVESGEPLIECHHTKPVHTLRAGSRTNLSDLVLPLRELP